MYAKENSQGGKKFHFHELHQKLGSILQTDTWTITAPQIAQLQMFPVEDWRSVCQGCKYFGQSLNISHTSKGGIDLDNRLKFCHSNCPTVHHSPFISSLKRNVADWTAQSSATILQLLIFLVLTIVSFLQRFLYQNYLIAKSLSVSKYKMMVFLFTNSGTNNRRMEISHWRLTVIYIISDKLCDLFLLLSAVILTKNLVFLANCSPKHVAFLKKNSWIPSSNESSFQMTQSAMIQFVMVKVKLIENVVTTRTYSYSLY